MRINAKNIKATLKMPIGEAFRTIFTKSAAPTTQQPVAYNNSRSGFGSGGQSGGAKSSHGMAFNNRTLSLDHHRLRQNARLAMQDSPQGRAIVETKANAVAHTGLKLEPTPSAGILGITQEEAAKWAKNTSERFNLWSDDKNAHRSEVMTFNQFQWLYAFWKERDNDIFTRLYYDTQSKNLQNPLQFESIDPDQIGGCAYTTSYGHQPTSNGLITDNRGRTIGFKVQVRELVSTVNGFSTYRYKEVPIQKKSKSGRVFMLHGFKPEYAGQLRGFTKLAPILNDLEKATDFTLANINYAISKSRIMAWIKPSEDEDSKSITDNSETAFGGSPAGDNFESPSEDADEDAERVGQMRCYDTPENTYGEPNPIFIQNLLRGQDLKFAPDSAAAQMYSQFMESFLGDLSACTGTPLEAVRMKVSSSFSAGRAMFLLFQRVIEIVREDQVADCNGPVYEMWMSGEIAAGRITAPGWSDPRLRKAWLKATWRGTPVPDIDPGKLAKASMMQIEMGIESAESISQRTSGKSAIDNITANNATYQGYESPPFSAAALAEISANDTAEEPDDDTEE